MTTQQAFVTEAFHPDDSIREIYADLLGRASRKARDLGGVFAEPGIWTVQPPLEDDDECYHVRLMFSITVPDCVDGCRICGDESNVVRGQE